MFGLSFGEIFVIGIIALIFIGPEELPVIARTIARFINDLKNSASGLTDEIKKQANIDLQPKKMSEQIFDLATNAMTAKVGANQAQTDQTAPMEQNQTGSVSNTASKNELKPDLSAMNNSNQQFNANTQILNQNTGQSLSADNDSVQNSEFRIQAEPLAVPLKPKVDVNEKMVTDLSSSANSNKESQKND